jgi:hypothetical protein
VAQERSTDILFGHFLGDQAKGQAVRRINLLLVSESNWFEPEDFPEPVVRLNPARLPMAVLLLPVLLKSAPEPLAVLCSGDVRLR